MQAVIFLYLMDNNENTSKLLGVDKDYVADNSRLDDSVLPGNGYSP